MPVDSDRSQNPLDFMDSMYPTPCSSPSASVDRKEWRLLDSSPLIAPLLLYLISLVMTLNVAEVFPEVKCFAGINTPHPSLVDCCLVNQIRLRGHQ